MSRFEELLAKYGSYGAASNEDLFACIDTSRETLIGRDAEELRISPVGQEVRRRTKQDLFWAARFFTWETNPAGAGKSISHNLISEEEYRIVCDFFVRKDNTDNKQIKGQDRDFKNRLLLWPRAGFKSTVDICDSAQWILNFPDIRILFLAGVDDLSVGFLTELKGHFMLRPEEPTLMNIFFPEFCLEERDFGNEFEFVCPLWAAKKIKRKEPTVLASSVGSRKSGWHFEIIKADDTVCDKNSSPEQCPAVSKDIFLAEKLLQPGGYYLDYVGTRYAEEDHYGVLLEKNVGNIRTTSGPGWTLTENTSTGMKILVGRAITIKPEVVLQLEKDGKPITYVEAGEEGCDLLIPKVMPYKWLMNEWGKNEEVFEGQLNQNPRPTSQTTFDRPLLLRNTISFDQMPFRGPVSQTWDFAFSKKKGRDYSTGSSVMWNDKGQMFVQDLIRARFKPTDLAKAVVDFARKWRPFIIGIENAAGSQLLEPTILAEAKKTGDEQVIAICSKIDWFTPETQADAKKIRMAALHPWLVNNCLKFANYLPFLQVLYDEFERCLTTVRGHNDIPDVLSQQPRYAPAMQQVIDKNEMSSWSRSDATWNLLYLPDCDAFGRPGMGVPPPVVDIEPEPTVRPETPDPCLPCILGAGLWG